MQIFRYNFIALCCVMLAVMLACPSAYGQLNHGELMDEYARQMQLLPPLSVTTEFGGQISEDQLKDRFENFLVEPRRKLLALTAEPREQFRKQLKLPAGENAFQKFFEDDNKKQLEGFQVEQQTTGVYEFFNGNHKEFRRYSPDGDILRTTQFGLAQPKLRSSNQNVWVSKEFSEKHDRNFILSELSVAFAGMLPVGLFKGSIHRSVDQKFSSGFDLFWENAPEIKFWGKAGEADVYIKQDSDDATKWLVACFEDPRNSIVPLWLVEVHASTKYSLDAKYLSAIIDVVAQLPKNETTLVPEGVYAISLTLFQERTSVEQFKGYPRLIRHLVPIGWESNQAGFYVIAPLLDFRMQVTDLTLRPQDREAFAIEDGSSYFDDDRKLGKIIGDTLGEIIRHSSLKHTPNGIRLERTRGGRGPRF